VPEIFDSNMPKSESQSTRTQPFAFRYEIIDGIRGLAALTVVLHHLQVVTVGPYAVVVFFVISGYCIAASTEVALQRHLTFRSYMSRRLRRIYPPYFFAVLFYIATRVVKLATTGQNQLVRQWLDWVQTFTLTQWLWLPLHPVADAPQNPKLIVSAFWSLNYEEQFYLVMGMFLMLVIARGVRISWLVGAMAIAGLTWNFLWPDGWITGFFIEYWVHFSLGAMLFYVLCVFPQRVARIMFVAAVAALGAYCAYHLISWSGIPAAPVRALRELAVASSFTLILFFARPASAWLIRQKIWKPLAALGTISYSLYLVHQFNLQLVGGIVDHLVRNAPNGIRIAALVSLHIGIGAAFWYLFERPFLNRKSKARTRPSEADVGHSGMPANGS
jgi:peptidoglycan/LPS O-acetylase OafA/YrhL